MYEVGGYVGVPVQDWSAQHVRCRCRTVYDGPQHRSRPTAALFMTGSALCTADRSTVHDRALRYLRPTAALFMIGYVRSVAARGRNRPLFTADRDTVYRRPQYCLPPTTPLFPADRLQRGSWRALLCTVGLSLLVFMTDRSAGSPPTAALFTVDRSTVHGMPQHRLRPATAVHCRLVGGC